jgi:hypothetical protein
MKTSIPFLFLSSMLILGSMNCYSQNSSIPGETLIDLKAKESKVLDKDYIAYHWEPRLLLASLINPIPMSGHLPVTSPQVTQRVLVRIQSGMQAFWNLNTPIINFSGGNKEDTIAPNGYYVATNPAVSRTWGDMVYQMSLRKGMRYIEGRSTTSFSSNIKNFLYASGCKNKFNMNALIRSSTSEVQCRAALAEIIRQTESYAIVYRFDNEPLAHCKSRGSSAFVLVSMDAVKSGSILPLTLTTPEVDDGFNKTRALINGVFKLSSNLNLAPPFPISAALSSDVERYTIENYFGCGQEQ